MRKHFLALLFLLAAPSSFVWGQADTLLRPAFLKQYQTFLEQSAYDDAIHLCQNYLDANEGNTNNGTQIKALLKWKIADCHFKINKINDALNFYQEAAQLYPNHSSQEQLAISKINRKIGSCQLKKGNTDTAISFFQKVLDCYTKHLPEDDSDFGVIYTDLGICYSYTIDIDKALLYFEKTLALDIKNYGKDHLAVATDYNNLGALSFQISKYKEALNYFSMALPIRLAQLPEEHYKNTRLYGNLGMTYRELGDYKKAHNYLTKEYKALVKQKNINYHSIVKNLRSTSKTYLRQQQFQTAKDSFEQAIHIVKTKLDYVHPQLDDLYSELGLTYDSLGQYELAIAYQDSAMKVIHYEPNSDQAFEKVASRFSLLLSLERKANMFIKWHENSNDKAHLLAALKANRTAIELIDFVKTEFYDTNSKQFLLESNYEIYESAIFICQQLWEQHQDDAYLTEAFKYAEKSKSILLLDALKETKAKSYAGIPDSLLAVEDSLKIDLAYFKRLRIRATQKNDAKLKEINESLFNLQQSYYDLLSHFQSDFPSYYKLKYQKTNSSISDIQSKLLNDDKTLLEFFVGQKNIYAFVINKNDFKVHRIKKDFPLDDWITAIRLSISQYPNAGTTIDSLNQQLVDLSYKLHQKLFNNFKETLHPGLIIIPDGALAYLPFEVLLTERPENVNQFRSHAYLLNNHMISYGYSATMLNTSFDTDSIGANKNLLAVAPYFGGAPNKDMMRGDTLNYLQHNTIEANIICDLMGGDLIKGNAANLSSFVQKAKDYHIIHLATHGKANDRRDELSYLAFTQTEDSINKGFLFLKDIFNLPLNAELIVLSACETGIGEFKKGEGVMSLSRGFAYAGAKSIVTSLWKISDASTANLMQHFYSNLSTGMTKDKALTKAKKNYIANQRDHAAHPFHWAAFIPIGDMAVIDEVVKTSVWAWILAGLILIVLLTILFRNATKKEDEPQKEEEFKATESLQKKDDSNKANDSLQDDEPQRPQNK